MLFPHTRKVYDFPDPPTLLAIFLLTRSIAHHPATNPYRSLTTKQV
jgi:hypothetical protein